MSEPEDSALSPDAALPFDPCQTFVKLLQKLQDGQKPQDDTPATASDTVLDRLHYKYFPALCRARAILTVKSKDKKIDVIFRACIMGMVGTLNLYLDPELSYTWCEASLIVSKSQGQGGSKPCKKSTDLDPSVSQPGKASIPSIWPVLVINS